MGKFQREPFVNVLLSRQNIRSMELSEQGAARYLRGECHACGHTWRPRNPSTAFNRCPGCGRRGKVEFTRFDGKPDA